MELTAKIYIKLQPARSFVVHEGKDKLPVANWP